MTVGSNCRMNKKSIQAKLVILEMGKAWPEEDPVAVRTATEPCGNGTRSPPITAQHHHQQAPASAPARLRCPAPISRLRVEKIEGGLMVAGVVVAANCQIVLPIFGFLFLLVGCVLTAASYRGPSEGEDSDSYAARVRFNEQSRLLGPACVTIGVIMLMLGAALCWATRRARRKAQRVAFHCPVHGDFYPISPVTASRIIGISDGSRWPLCCRRSGRPGAVHAAPPQCPHSQVSSTRSSLSSSPVSPCPTPQPFLINSGSVGGLVPLTGAQLSPDQTFGSIRSLSVSREVASFPLSRTPTPPPITSVEQRLISPPNTPSHRHVESIPHGDTNVNVSPGVNSTNQRSTPPRKSVSIVLPSEQGA